MHPADALAERLGLAVHDRDLLAQALIHSSWLHEHPDAARRSQRAPRVPGRRRRQPRRLRGPVPPPPRRRRGRPVRPPGGDREHPRPRPARDPPRPRLVPAPRRGRGPARRARPAVPPGVGVRGAGRGDLPRPRLGRRARLDPRAGGGGARRRPRDHHPQEPQEPAPGAHPADDRRAAALPAGRGGRARTTRSSSGSRSRSTGRTLGRRARARRGGSPRRRPRPRRSRCSGASARIAKLAEVGAATAARRDARDERARMTRARPGCSGLRVQGFKSFAERTLVEFGPGISAVVGPNGSGKSNLADALRWALGEQGRSLRIRRSEDVIWAGSEKRRSAQGMADVTLVLDNGDALLPVEYSVVELGRRLYRSGENDYLLNRQRVRLRDLVDLLDSANLAENAFLFIGQGMVDQALALRPEERRPLFEEVAGVRRHERRRRKAEEQLAEAEGNLARVEDILAELRPQARRLGQLAEQQATRLTAGEELAAALIVAAHARWHEAATRAADAERGRDALRAESGLALEALEQRRVRGRRGRGVDGRPRRARGRATRAPTRRPAPSARRSACARRARSASSRPPRATGRGSPASAPPRRPISRPHRRGLAQPVPEPDLALEAALADADRALAEGLAELGALRAASRARGDELAARASRGGRPGRPRPRPRAGGWPTSSAGPATRRRGRRRRPTRAAELEAALEAAASDARRAPRTRRSARRSQRARRPGWRPTRPTASGAPRRSGRRRPAARWPPRPAGWRRSSSAWPTRRRAASRRRPGSVGGTARRRRAGRRSRARPAVEAALGELARAYVVEQAAVGGLGARARPARGPRADRRGGPRTRRRHAGGASAGSRTRSTAAGGGRLRDAVRRDESGCGAGAARPCGVGARPGRGGPRSSRCCRWAGWSSRATAARCSIRSRSGWVAATRRSRPGPRASAWRARPRALEREAAEAAARPRRRRGGRSRRRAAALDARSGGRVDGVGRRGAGPRRRSAPPVARSRRPPARRRGSASRPIGSRPSWNAPARRSAALRGADAAGDGPGTTAGGDGPGPAEPDAIAAWEARLGELRDAARSPGRRGRRPTIARGATPRPGARARRPPRRWPSAASRPPTATSTALGVREQAAADERTAVAGAIAEANATGDARARGARGAAGRRSGRARPPRRRRAGGDGRARAAAGERRPGAGVRRRGHGGAPQPRVAARAGAGRAGRAWARSGSAPRRGIRPRAGTGWCRGRLELAGVAERGESADDGTEDDGEALGEADGSAEGAALEAALERLAPAWSVEPPAVEPPTPGRLAVLRRRFHELGAANPFAVDEYRSVRDRLETLEAQHRDLRDAIARTRSLIADLDELIATQFRSTFAALEVAFDARFQQLFGGGFARLSLTDPTDLATTGIEITARPPGKKPQALAMLSGGERALTAVALLFAMLEVRPAPFCVLDEVDAALDEANVGRFTEALQRSRSRRSSSSSPTTGARSRSPTRSTGSPSATTR